MNGYANHMSTEDPSALPTRVTAPTTPAATATGIEPERLVELIAGFAADKKAIDVVALDLRGVAGYTDYFVICSGGSDRQAKAIHDGVHEGMKKEHGVLPRRVEGLTESSWVLMDYLDVVVHVFTPDTRDFYRLETLWGDVPRVELPEA